MNEPTKIAELEPEDLSEAQAAILRAACGILRDEAKLMQGLRLDSYEDRCELLQLYEIAQQIEDAIARNWTALTP